MANEDAKNRAQIAQLAPSASIKPMPGNPQQEGRTAALPRTARDPLEQAAFAQKMQQGAARDALASLPQPSLGQRADGFLQQAGNALGAAASRAGHYVNNARVNPLQSVGGAALGLLNPALGTALMRNALRYDPSSFQQSAAPAAPPQAVAAPAKASLTQDPQQWGKTAYGNAVGRRTADGYAFSNQAADMRAGANNTFVGRDGTAGRISNKGSLHLMPSKDMWRDLGGQQGGDLSLSAGVYADGGARAAGRSALPASMQNIRSSGVTVVDDGTELRNAALRSEFRGQDLLHAARNSGRRSEFRALSQQAAQMAGHAQALREQGALLPGQRRAQQEERAQAWAEGAGRRTREGLENQALEQGIRSAAQAQQVQREQQARLLQLQAMAADPSLPAEQRLWAQQSLQAAQPFNKDRYMKLSGGADELGSTRPDRVLDLLTQQYIGGEGEDAGGALRLDEGWYEFPDGRQVKRNRDGSLEELRQ